MKTAVFAAMTSVLLLASCSHVISSANRQGALVEIPFREVMENPSPYLGQMFIFGGTIAETTNRDEGSEIEIVQNPIDRYGYIVETDFSEGRFLVTSRQHLDPLIFRKERLVTIAGVLTGTRQARLGDAEYRYPVLEAREIHLWREVPPYPYPYGYYDPLYYPYYTAPYPYGYGPLIGGSQFYYERHFRRH